MAGTLRRAVAIGADIDINMIRQHYEDCVWLAHIVDPVLVDGFLLDHKPDLAMVSPLTVERIPLLERRHPDIVIVPFRRDPSITPSEAVGPARSESVPAKSEAITIAAPQQMVAIWSPKGGVGKSFVATNTAVITATRNRGNVALLDLDLHSSDVGVYLNLLEGPSIVETLPHLGDLSPEDLSRYMLQHPQSGLWVLRGPARPEMADFVRAEQVARILDLARRRFKHVFIDLPPHAGEDMVYECLEQATSIVLVTTQDAAALRQTRLTLEIMGNLRIDLPARVRLVVNRYHSNETLSLERLEGFIGQPVFETIPEDRRSAELSLFEGTPLALTGHNRCLTDSLTALALNLCSGQDVSKPKESGLFAALRRRWGRDTTRAS